jgi:hypothetical protein
MRPMFYYMYMYEYFCEDKFLVRLGLEPATYGKLNSSDKLVNLNSLNMALPHYDRDQPRSPHCLCCITGSNNQNLLNYKNAL